MNYLKDLTKEEIKYICTVIPFQEAFAYFKKYPKEFSKLKPGFRVKSLNEDTVIKTLYEFRNRDFIASFIIKHIELWVEQINSELLKAADDGLDQITALISVLSRSYFSENISLYFKIKEEEKSAEYLDILSAAVLYRSVNRKADEEETDILNKRITEYVKENDELLKQVSEKEKKIEKLRKRETSLTDELIERDSLLVNEQEKSAGLLEKVEMLEIDLRKTRENELWKTASMQQKIDQLSNKVKEQIDKELDREVEISEYKSSLTSAQEEIETWKNKVRERDSKIFTLKAQKATDLAEKESLRKQIKELKSALEESLSVEKTYKEQLSALSTETCTFEEHGSITEKQNQETVVEIPSNPDRKVPMIPECMDDFDEYFCYNLENIGFNFEFDEARAFVELVKKRIFNGVPILIKRGPGLNLANCLANTLYGMPNAAHFIYGNNNGVKEIDEFLSKTPHRVVCIDGFVGNINEMELIPVLDQYRNKIIFLTYMYDQTLRFIPKEILSYVQYISADKFSPMLTIKNITEDPSEIREIPLGHGNNAIGDGRLKKIFREIACECGLDNDSATIMSEMIEDENYLDEMLLFSLLPYVSNVLNKKPYRCSKRLQRYAGDSGRCHKKDIMMRWFG